MLWYRCKQKQFPRQMCPTVSSRSVSCSYCIVVVVEVVLVVVLLVVVVLAAAIVILAVVVLVVAAIIAAVILDLFIVSSQWSLCFN